MHKLPWAAALLLAFATGHAATGVTSPANSTIPPLVLMVGSDDGRPDTTTGAFVVVARDLSNNPQRGRTIELRAINCPGARVAADQGQLGVTAKCATHGITAVTDADGLVRMALVGGGDAAAPRGSGPCGQVYADGAPLGFVRVAYLDLDGQRGLGAGDLSVWLGDFLAAEPIARADYDGDDQVGAADLSLWLTVFGAGGQPQSPAAYCP